MSKKLEKLKKDIKSDNIFIFIMLFFITIITCFNAVNIITYSQKESSSFEMKLAEEGEDKDSYCLFIEDENYGKVNYNDYSLLDSNGNKNEKVVFMIDEISSAVNLVMIGVIFLISYFMIKSVVNEGRPFAKKNINRMRSVAILIILIAVIPSTIKGISTFVIFSNAVINVDLFVMTLGVIFGVISELFKFGYELQEDVDMIA